MRRGGRVLVILGILLALVSGVGVFTVLATATPQAAEVKTVNLVVAVQNITERSEVTADEVSQVPWPVTIPTPTGAYEKPTEVLGKLAMVPVYPGQPLVDKMLIDKSDLKEDHSNASLLLEKGYVAVAMPVTIHSNVAEAIQAGDHVDVVATFTAQPISEGNQPAAAPVIATQHLMQDVLILQTGPWPGPAAKSSQGGPVVVVTLQLKEQDALVLKYAQENATALSLVLRPANDHDLENPEPVTLEYINKRFNYRFPGTGQ